MSNRHSLYNDGQIHTRFNWTFADEAARLSDTNPNTGAAYTSTDLYRDARQADNNTTWLLVGLTPDWEQGGAEFTAGSGLTLSSSEFSLGGTLTANAVLTPDTDGDHTVNIGADSSNRVDTFNAFAENFAGLQAGSLNDRSFVSIFGDTLGGLELGYFENESDLMGLRINLAKDGNFEAVDAINSKGIIYAADYSTNFTDRSLVDKAYVDGEVGTGNIYDNNGTLTGARTVTGNSGDSLTFEHFNGTSSTYTLRGEVEMDDDNVTILAALGDGFGADLASTSLTLANSGLSISTGVGDTDIFLNQNDWLFYEGANDTTTNLLTIHGDGEHSVFDPYVTLHEGFATGNGTDSQALVVNFGKANKVQWNDGTRSVDIFAIESIVNGSQVFQHMETFFGGIQHRYTGLDNFKWYFEDSPGTGLWRIYEDDTEANLLLQVDTSGNLTADGYLSADQLALGKASPTGSRLIDAIGPSNADLQLEFESGDSSLYDVIIALESENAWHFVSEHFDGSTAFGDLVIRDDTSAQEYLRFDQSQTQIVTPSGIDLTVGGEIKAGGETLVPAFPSNISGAATNQTVTTSDQVITLDTTNIDGAGGEYTIDLASNHIEMDNADGSRIYEVNWQCKFLLENQGTTGATRSYAIFKARLDDVDISWSEQWTYIREYQGGTNGIPNEGGSGFIPDTTGGK